MKSRPSEQILEDVLSGLRREVAIKIRESRASDRNDLGSRLLIREVHADLKDINFAQAGLRRGAYQHTTMNAMRIISGVIKAVIIASASFLFFLFVPGSAILRGSANKIATSGQEYMRDAPYNIIVSLKKFIDSVPSWITFESVSISACLILLIIGSVYDNRLDEFDLNFQDNIFGIYNLVRWLRHARDAVEGPLIRLLYGPSQG